MSSAEFAYRVVKRQKAVKCFATLGFVQTMKIVIDETVCSGSEAVIIDHNLNVKASRRNICYATAILCCQLDMERSTALWLGNSYIFISV